MLDPSPLKAPPASEPLLDAVWPLPTDDVELMLRVRFKEPKDG